MKATRILVISVCILTLTLILCTNNSRKTHSTPKHVTVEPMNESVFWDIISNFDWKTKDERLIMQPAVDILSKFSIEDIYKFDDILSEKLYLLDGSKFGPINSSQYFSSDMFLYRRCFVVASGKDYFNSVLSNPRDISSKETETFEGFLFLPATAFSKKISSDKYNHKTKYSYETGSNTNAWTQ